MLDSSLMRLADEFQSRPSLIKISGLCKVKCNASEVIVNMCTPEHECTLGWDA